MAKHKVIVEATGISSGTTTGQWTAAEIEAVMARAITEMVEAGEQDPDKIKAAMAEHVEQFKASRRAQD